MAESSPEGAEVRGSFVTLGGERYYAIENVDAMETFFISLVSDGDHWMFVASNGGLTAGRVSPETALFPYETVDKIYDGAPHTGCKTIVRVGSGADSRLWEPFNGEHDGVYRVRRNLFKNLTGNRLLFEEINEDLQIAFRYSWATSDRYGFVRESELENLGAAALQIDVVDGLQNILPASVGLYAQTNLSYLLDAYKWNEVDDRTGLALYTMFSALTDRAEPLESLKANTVFCLGLDQSEVLLSTRQLGSFRKGAKAVRETATRGQRGAYLVRAEMDLEGRASRHWRLVADVEKSQADCVALRRELEDPATLAVAISRSVDEGSDALRRIMGAGDGFQATDEETVSTHHYANVLFNVLRGGIFDEQYLVSSKAFGDHLRGFNRAVHERYRDLLGALPDKIESADLMALLRGTRDDELERLGFEYLPLTFGRRHGDPSRPWNKFAIKLADESGERLLSYEGNWRDIFQNWEALLLGYPEFAEHIIAKFVNASTIDGYNPYRITNEGIDWEEVDPHDPWSYIGYWGDHQIIYLLKLLELSQAFHPAGLTVLLSRPLFSYANVPYRIKPFESLLEDAKDTVVYDTDKAERLARRVADMGADGKLVLDRDGGVYQVNLLEKLVVPLLSKLGNLVVDGGIWLNTQRPEWNDANNALVGQGLSMVTTCYLRRYVAFLIPLAESLPSDVSLSVEVGEWLDDTATALRRLSPLLGKGPLGARERFGSLRALGQAASRYRTRIYEQDGFSGVATRSADAVRELLGDALAAIDHTIETNRRDDGLYHSYNLLSLSPAAARVDTLYPMLEGQVAALSSGSVPPEEAATLLESLFDSALFRTDQNSFLLYPERSLPGFLDKNRILGGDAEAVPVLGLMLERADRRLVLQDEDGALRFHAGLTNVDALNARIDELIPVFGADLESARADLKALYEEVFDHQSFTGRSGGMFAFEGLGSIYWHMVSKLLLAAQEQFFSALEGDADPATLKRLGDLYYRIREGIGFNKTPSEYGAFPTDPYSHTPRHMGAQQPGMTGQVKEEMITRFGELGVRVRGGAVKFAPALLREREFISESRGFRYLDVAGEWQTISLDAASLAFTWCQVPLVYRLDDSAEPSVTVVWKEGKPRKMLSFSLPADIAGHLFERNGHIERIELTFGRSLLHPE